MLRIPFEEIVAKIREKSGLDEQEITQRVDSKVKQLSGLVSREGAAHILANELGIRLFEQTSGRLQIKNILSGMRDVEITGKVISLSEVKSFQTNGRDGKVASILLADESGQVRIVLWNEQANNAPKIKAGDIIKIKGGYVRQRNSSNEVHLNERGRLILNPEGETVNVEIQAFQPPEKTRKHLSELQGTESSVEVLATIVQVFEPRYFEVCHCGKRAKPSEGGATCDFHGAIKPAYSYVLNAFIDDGTDNVRAVFFREQAQKLINRSNDEILKFKDSPELFEAARNEVLGANVRVIGRATKNEMFDRTELIANSVVLNPDPEPEIARMEEELNKLRENKA
ncbi:DUF2240 family protein [Candidatus Woesearchaeota archaeon]|nr:DUF2240 family protein [Candidatus Woesearchaeota archaeon]